MDEGSENELGGSVPLSVVVSYDLKGQRKTDSSLDSQTLSTISIRFHKFKRREK